MFTEHLLLPRTLFSALGLLQGPRQTEPPRGPWPGGRAGGAVSHSNDPTSIGEMTCFRDRLARDPKF